MSVKLNPTKAKIVLDLLQSNSNRFTTVQLLNAVGNERRARSALFHARLSGMTLEALRDGGRAVIAYISNGPVPTLSAPVAKAKTAKASPKKAAAAKTKPAAKAKKVVVDHSASNKRIAKAIKSGDLKIAKVISVGKSPEDVDAIKAKNLETMKAVSKREKTMLDKIKEDTRAEFSAMEAEWEAEEADRRDARTAVRENLPKEAYVE
jgi:hypothetical protein